MIILVPAREVEADENKDALVRAFTSVRRTKVGRNEIRQVTTSAPLMGIPTADPYRSHPTRGLTGDSSTYPPIAADVASRCLALALSGFS